MARDRHTGGALVFLVGPAVVALLLLGIFSLLPRHRLAGDWPLGIAREEVAAYAGIFDRRPDDTVAASLDVYELLAPDSLAPCPAGDAEGPPNWAAAVFRSEDGDHAVQVRRLRTREGGWVVKFPSENLFRSQRQLVLIPAGGDPVRAKFEQVLADELGVIAPEVSFVRLRSCGRDLGLFIKEERVDGTFLRKRRLVEAERLELGFDPWRPDQLMPGSDDPGITGPLFRDRLLDHGSPGWSDQEELVNWALLLWLCDREDLLHDGTDLVLVRTTGLVRPLYRTRRGTDRREPLSMLADRPLVRALRSATVRSRMKERREALLAEAWRLDARLQAMEEAWSPLLASGDRGLGQARATRVRSALLERLREGDPIAWWDRPLLPPAGARQYALERRDRSLAEIAGDLGGRVLGDTLFLDRGRYRVREDLVLPPGAALVLLSGARLELDPGRSILCRGPLHVRATPINPVFIRPAVGDSAFGSLAVSGDGSTPCTIDGLRMSGGQGASVAGMHHSGMLSLHGVHLAMRRSELEDGRGEDLLNLKDSEVLIEGCRFVKALSDLVDLDRCTGSVVVSWFDEAGSAGEGDALDLGGGRLSVSECVFQGAGDKGLSVGEIARVAVRGCTFRDNTIGMAVKDLSIAHVEGCLFTGNDLVFSVRRASGIYGGARLFLYPNTFVDNGRDREVDTLSRIEPREAWDEERLEGL